MRFNGALSHIQLEGVLSKKKKKSLCVITNVILGLGLWKSLRQVRDPEVLVLLASWEIG